MPQDPDPIFIALGVRENRSVYTLIFKGKRLQTFDSACEAIKARTALEKPLKEEAK
jgi:hypothetical protein